MHRDWLAMEHYRMHVIEHWPESPAKHAGLAAVRATLKSLAQTAPSSETPFECAICLSRQRKAKLLQFPDRAALFPVSIAA